MATLTPSSSSVHLKTLIPSSSISNPKSLTTSSLISPLRFNPLTTTRLKQQQLQPAMRASNRLTVKSMAVNRNGNIDEPRETISLPGCDDNHWFIDMEFPKDPAPTRGQMIETYLNTLATVLGSMEEAKKNM